jgi:hypothetical protein
MDSLDPRGKAYLYAESRHKKWKGERSRRLASI